MLNKNTKQLQKEAQRRLDDLIDSKNNYKIIANLKALTLHSACDEWLEHYKNHSGSKPTTIKWKISNTNTIKNAINKEILINTMTHTYLQEIISEWSKKHSKGYVQSFLIIIHAVFKYFFNTINKLI